MKPLYNLYKYLLISGVYLWTITNWVKLWSNVYNRIWNWNKHSALSHYRTEKQLARFLETATYSKDGVRELFDVFPYPEAVEYRYKHGMPIGDCGAFAYYAAKTAKSLDEKPKTSILTVFWFVSPNSIKSNAHNVALLSYDGRYRFVDYGIPVPALSSDLYQIASQVAKRFDSDAVVFSWSVRDLNLNVLERSK